MLPEVDLAPKGVGALLDDAIAMCRANAAPLAIVSCLVVLPLALAMSVAQVFYLRGILEVFGRFSESTSPEQFASGVNSLQGAGGAAYSAMPLFLLARAFMAAAVVTAGPLMLYGRSLHWRELIKPGWRNPLTYIGAQIVVFLIVGFATLPAFLLGLITVVGLLVTWLLPAYLWARWSVTGVTVVAEGCGVGDAMRRSWTLTSKRFWRTLGFAISLWLVTYAVSAAIQSPSLIRQIVVLVNDPRALFRPMSVGWTVFEGLLAALSVALVVPFSATAWYRYYLDLRSRSEGMDLLVRADDLAEDASR